MPRIAWFERLVRVIQQDAAAEREDLRTRGVITIPDVRPEDFVDPVTQRVRPLPPGTEAYIRIPDEDTVNGFMGSYAEWVLGWVASALETEHLEDMWTADPDH